ncbi:MAG TPA: hypothetical protein PKC69_05135 [Chitinophagaceae bacterium]|nr:hypothetical protein [Chitinophagaceae bacterium]
MMKIRSGALFAVFSTLLIISGCQRNGQELSNPDMDTTAFTAADAKIWFDQNIGTTLSLGSDGKQRFKNPVPQWGQALSCQDKNWHIIETPVRFDKTPGLFERNRAQGDNTESSTRLLVLKSKKTGFKPGRPYACTAG